MRLTSIWAESIFLVLVVVACGGAPTVAIPTTFCGAAVILIPQKDEREDALSPIRVSSDCVKNCQKDGQR